MRPVIVAALFIVAAACGGDVRRSDPSTLEAAVHVETTGCGQATRLAGGSFIADRRVVTVAHVVAGTTGVVVVSSDGRRHPATVVGIDRHKDLALLAVDDATVDPLPIGSMAVGDVGELLVFREGRSQVVEFTARRKVGIKMDSIDEDSVTVRRGYQIEADVLSGDSGAVLVVGGAATAMVFARSRGDEHRAWATDISEIEPLLAADTGRPVDLGACSEFA